MMMEWMGLGFLILAVILAGLLAAAIYVGVRAGVGWGRRGDDGPKDVLDRRFAAGEIDADEYHERLAALRSAEAADRRG